MKMEKTSLPKNHVNVQGYTLIRTLLRKNHFNGGYTLIEILVGLTIVSLIFASGYIAFREFSRRQIVASAIRAMVGDIRLAQTEALAGKKPSQGVCQGTNTLQGYNFGIAPPSSYYIEAQCTGGNVEIKRIDLSTLVTLQSPTPNPILFKVLGLGTNIPQTESAVVTLTAFGSDRTVTISPGGSVE